MLSNVGLRDAIRTGQLAIEGLKEESIQLASIDLHLGNKFIFPNGEFFEFRVLDMYDRESMEDAFSPPMLLTPGVRIGPGDFFLAATERVTLSNELVAQVAGKSSVARAGIMVESAGFIDPGFDGPITLEIYNQMPFSILLIPGMPICQIAVTRLDIPADGVYGGKYVGSDGPVASRYWMNKRPGESV